MNKHQYALDNIGSTYFTMNYVANEKLRLEFEKMYNEYKQTLQELVDRATHKRVITDKTKTLICPNCGFRKIYTNYCPHCGQAIDWSTNED